MRKYLLMTLLLPSCASEVVAYQIGADGEPGAVAAGDGAGGADETGEHEDDQSGIWTLNVMNLSEVDLDHVEICFDASRLACAEAGDLASLETVTRAFAEMDVTQVQAFGFDASRAQWYTTALIEGIAPRDGDSFDVYVEELGCGLYQGDRFYLTLHGGVVAPTKSSGSTWDTGISWSDWDFISDVVDLVVDEYAGDLTGDISSEIVDGLGENLEAVTTGTVPPDMVYHLATYDAYDRVVVDDPSDDFPLANTVYHEYDRGESNNAATENTIFPVFDDSYVVSVPEGQQLYLNAYDVDTIGSDRIGGFTLDYETLQSYADCGLLSNAPGSELLLAMSVTVESLPAGD